MTQETKPAKPKLYPCSRCDGTGIVNWARHYANGVCFQCHGTKVQATKPSKSVRWCVLDSNGAHMYNIDAPTQAKAIKKALVTLAKASADFQAKHPAESLCAVLYREYWTDERIEAAHYASQGREKPQD